MSFEAENLQKKAATSPESGSPAEETLESIEAKLAALGDPDDPWAEPEAVAEREKLLAKKQEMLKQAERKESFVQEAKAAVDRAANEQIQMDEASATELAERIKSGQLSEGNQEQELKVPNDAEILDQYGQTVSLGDNGVADSMPDNLRFSRMAMLTLLDKNFDNVLWVPAQMLREPSFKKVLERKFNEVSRVKDSQEFEKFYAALFDPDFNLLLAKPKWKDSSAKEIELMKLRAKDDTENARMTRIEGSVLQQYYKEREELGRR